MDFAEVVSLLNHLRRQRPGFTNFFLPRIDLTSYDAEGMRPSFLHGHVFIGNAKHTASETNAVRLPAGTLVPVCAVAIEAGRVLVRHSLPTLPVVETCLMDD